MVALLRLSSWCLVIVVWLLLAVSCFFLQFVIVVFPDHTHLKVLLLQMVEQFLTFTEKNVFI